MGRQRIWVTGNSGQSNQEICMKNKITLSSHIAMAGLGIVTLCLLTPLQAAPKAESGKSLSAADKSFMKKAAKGGKFEVEWGKAASDKGEHADVKKFGNRMVTDHSKAGDELKAIASRKGVTLPETTVKVDWKSDKAYMNMMVKDHEKDLSEFQEEGNNGSDPDVKKFAAKTAKMIQKHLDLAKKTQAKLK